MKNKYIGEIENGTNAEDLYDEKYNNEIKYKVI